MDGGLLTHFLGVMCNMVTGILKMVLNKYKIHCVYTEL